MSLRTSGSYMLASCDHNPTHFSGQNRDAECLRSVHPAGEDEPAAATAATRFSDVFITEVLVNPAIQPRMPFWSGQKFV